jgi:hypothetical protein
MASATAESTALTLPSRDIMKPLQLTIIPSPGTSIAIPDSNLLITNDEAIQFITGIMGLVIQKPEILTQMTKIGVSDPTKALNDLITRMTNDITNNVVYTINITSGNVSTGDVSASDDSMIGGSKYKCLAIVYYLVFTFIICLFLGFGLTDIFNVRPNIVWLYSQVAEYIGWIWMYLYSSTRLGLGPQRDIYIAYLMTTICTALGIASIYNLPSWMANIILGGMGLVDAMCSNWPLLIDLANKRAVDEAERKAQVLDIISKTQIPITINSETQMLTQNQIVLALFSGYFGQTNVSTGENFNKFVNGLSMVNSAILASINSIKDASYADFGKLLIVELKKLQNKLITDTMNSTEGLESSDNAVKLREVRRMIGDIASSTATASGSSAATNNVATSPRRDSNSPGPRTNQGFYSIGGRRSRRRMQKSKRGNKRGGRSRMRKMRTKKRRMSRRKIRR